MKKIKKNIVIVALALCSVFTSCLHILDTAPYHQVSEVTMWTTENLTEMGVLGVYANLRNWGPFGNVINTAYNQRGNGMGQWAFEIFGPLGQAHSVADIIGGGFNPGSGNASNLWRRLFEGVHRANDALYHLPGAPVSETRRAQLIAEVRFLRAFHYYRLNEMWRGVPWYDVPVTVPEANRPQETETFIWERIIEDLTAAINEPQLPNIDLTSARVTRGAAYALRGKVHMQMGNWHLAINDFQRVGQMGHHLFQGEYRLLFTEAHERHPEMIFSVENIQGHPSRGSAAQFKLGTRSSQGSNWADHRITPFAVSRYENLDGTPFDWDDHFPTWSSKPPRAREVFFLRDTLRADGTEFESAAVNATGGISVLVRNRLTALSDLFPNINFDDYYLPHGNEERIRLIYANRDPRLHANVITPYSTFLGSTTVGAPGDFLYTMRWPRRGADGVLVDGVPVGDLWSDRNGSEFEYFQRKFVYEGFNGALFNRERGGIDDPIIRYADVLLLWAEALVELNDLPGAMARVAQVRDRVGMPTLASNFADQATARNYVRDERRREMLGEGGAFFDELRWGTLRETKFFVDAAGQAGTRQIFGVPGGGGQFRWPDVLDPNYRFVFPIPRVEIERNPNLRPTPGWTY